MRARLCKLLARSKLTGRSGVACNAGAGCVQMQQLLAGMADRGAQAVCIEASLLGTARGGMEWVRPDVAVMTTFEGGSFSQYDERAPHPCRGSARLSHPCKVPTLTRRRRMCSHGPHCGV